jgi:hypothetical protein
MSRCPDTVQMQMHCLASCETGAPKSILTLVPELPLVPVGISTPLSCCSRAGIFGFFHVQHYSLYSMQPFLLIIAAILSLFTKHWIGLRQLRLSASYHPQAIGSVGGDE